MIVLCPKKTKGIIIIMKSIMKIKAFLLIGILVPGFLTSCYPFPPERTREMPVMAEPDAQTTFVASIEPYMPENPTASGDWPMRPIALIVPFLPGGDTDMYARVFAPFLADALGQPIHVINVDGASGTEGAEIVRSSMPEGDIILFYHTGNLFTNVLTGMTELNYGDFDIACVAMHCDANIMVIRADQGINNAEQFLDFIKENPGGLSVATTITGFSFKLLRMAEIAGGFQTTPVHVGGGSMMAPSILGGYTEMGYNNIALFLEYIESGEMIPLWIAADERNALLPDVPTMAEVGIAGGYMGRSYFFAFPPGTDESILHRMSDTVLQITDNPLFKQQVFDLIAMPTFFVPYDDVTDYLGDMWVLVERLGIAQ